MKWLVRSMESEEETELKRHARFRLYLCYTVIFLVLAFVMFSQFFIYDKSLLTTDDGYLQWYSVLVKLKSAVSDFFSGKGFSLWSWDTGLGADWFGNYAIIFCDPFNYIAMFFTKETMDIAYMVIALAKMYAAGAATLSFLRYHRKTPMSCLIGSIGYVFCAWTLFGLRHDSFVIQMVIFPLLILGVDKVEDRKSPLTLILSVAASVIVSLYFSYMSAIFVCVYIVVRYFLREKKSFLDFLISMGKYILYAVTGGIFIAAPVLIPALYALVHASSGSGIDAQILPTLKQFLRFVPAFLGNYDVYHYTVLGANPLFVVMIPAIVLSWRKKKASVWMFFIGMVVAFFPFMQSVMNGFSYPAGRWCYIFVFFFAYAAVDCLSSGILQTKQYKKGLVIWLSILAGWSVTGLCMKAITPSNFAIIALNLAFCIIFYLLIKRQEIPQGKRMNYLAGLTFFNIGLLLFISFSPGMGNKLEDYMTTGKSYDIYESCSLKAAKKIKDRDFYRVDSVEKPDCKGQNIPFTTTPANTNIYWEVPSVFEYFSTIDANWFEFNRLLGNNSGYFRRVCTSSNDNRSRMDFLLGVKYFLGDNKEKGYTLSQYAGYGFSPLRTEDGVSVLKSKYKAGLGYVYENTISETDFMRYTPLEREQILMQSAEMADEDRKTLSSAKTAETGELNLITEQVPHEIHGSEDADVLEKQLNITQQNAEVTIKLNQEIKNSEVYVRFHNLKRKPFTVDEQWELQEKKAQKFWEQEKSVLFETDALAKAKFYSNFLSSTLYGSITILVSKDDVKKRLLNSEGEPRAIREIDDYMVNLGYLEKCSGEIKCHFQDTGQYSFDSIEVIAVPQHSFDVQAQKLEKNRLTVLEYGDNRVLGEINTEQGGLLYLSILYNDGWSVYVDDRKVDKVYKVNTAFTGVEVPAGSHKVELRYRPVGFKAGILLSAAGVIITLIFGLYYGRRRRRVRK